MNENNEKKGPQGWKSMSEEVKSSYKLLELEF
jgi:hypothetical protein